MSAISLTNGLCRSRTFTPFDLRLPIPSPEELSRILDSLGKHDPHQELNCGACGYVCQTYAEAIAEFQTGVKLSGSPLMLALLGHAYATSGKTAEAKQVLADLEQLQGQRYVSPYTVAAIHTGLGDQDQAFKWLESAVEERDIWLMNLKVDPVFARLRSEKRFQDLLTRTGLRP